MVVVEETVEEIVEDLKKVVRKERLESDKELCTELREELSVDTLKKADGKQIDKIEETEKK